MPSRSMHNMINSMILGFSGNDLHAYMDRAAKKLRQNHREVGHDSIALIQMLAMFSHKYKAVDIMKAWILHKSLDGMFSGIQKAVKANNKGYGKKKSTLEIVNSLKKEIMRM